MIEQSKEGSVPRGKTRRIGLVMEAACFQCDGRAVYTITNLTKRNPLRDRGWGQRRGHWCCERCMGREGSNKPGLRIVG